MKLDIRPDNFVRLTETEILPQVRLQPFHDFLSKTQHKITDARFKETAEPLLDHVRHHAQLRGFMYSSKFDNVSHGAASQGYHDQVLASIGSPLGEYVLCLETYFNKHTNTTGEVAVSREVQVQLASSGYTIPLDYVGHVGFHSQGDTLITGLTVNSVVRQKVIYPDGETEELPEKLFKEFDNPSLSLIHQPEDLLNPTSIARFDQDSHILYVTRYAKPNEVAIDRSEVLGDGKFE
jgi:hypothetical protein